MKIVIVGGAGFLGSSLSVFLDKENVVTVSREDDSADYCVDFSDYASSMQFLKDQSPDVIINCAAYADVDGCENNPDVAYCCNVKIALNISRYIKEHDCYCVHISTDQVYDESIAREDSKKWLGNNYSITKYWSEKFFNGCNAVVLRTNFFGWDRTGRGSGMIEAIVSKVKRKEKFVLFEDVYFSPLSIYTLCEMISHCLTQRIRGVFNCGARDAMSKGEFIHLFASRYKGEAINAEYLSIDDVDLVSPRPKDMTMNVTAIEAALGVKMPKLIDEMERVLDEV